MKKKITEDSPPFRKDYKVNTLNDIEDFIDNDIFSSEQAENKDYIFKSKKKGLLFPSVTILSVVIISSLIILFSDLIFNSEINNINMKISDQTKLESTLMSKYKIDTDQKIKDKDIKINTIQDKLDNYNEQLEILKNIIFAKNTGQVLNESIINSEYSGKSISEIEKTINDITSKKEEEEKNLFTETNEKNMIIKEANEIKTVFQITDSDIDVISEIQIKLEQQNLINSQKHMIYENIFTSINKGDYNKAREYIFDFNTLISIESKKNIPNYDEKKNNYKNILNIIEKYIGLKETTITNKDSQSSYSPDLAKLNILYSTIIYNMEARNFNSAMSNIKTMNSSLELSSNLETPEIINRKREYKRTLSIMKEYISLNMDFNDFKSRDRINQQSSEAENISIAIESDVIKEKLYTDYHGKSVIFGKIALKDNQDIIIEPFFDLLIKKGDSFLIKKDNTEIARGIITSSSEVSALGKIESSKNSDLIPAINNLVYIITD